MSTQIQLRTIDGYDLQKRGGITEWTVHLEHAASKLGIVKLRDTKNTLKRLVDDGLVTMLKLEDIGAVATGANNPDSFAVEFQEDFISGKGRRQTKTSYLLNETALVHFAMRSNTPTAISVQRQVVNVFVKARRGDQSPELGAVLAMLRAHEQALNALRIEFAEQESKLFLASLPTPPPTLRTDVEMAHVIFNAINDAALPVASLTRSKTFRAGFGSVHSQLSAGLNVRTYQDLPTAKASDALRLIAIIKGRALDSIAERENAALAREMGS